MNYDPNELDEKPGMPDLDNDQDDRIGNVVSERATDDPYRLGGTVKAPAKAKPRKKANTPKMIELHGKLMNWWNIERELQSWNRYQQAIDEDFYDGLQWDTEDAQALIERGQAPLVYNHIKPSVNWLLGTERRTRADGVVLPRNDDDENGAEVKSKLLKYLSDVNRLPFVRSASWEDCVIAGVGWLEDTISKDPSMELLNSRFESWRHVWYDSTSKEKDINIDARYLFRRKDVDLDYAIALCPEYEAELRAQAIDAEQLAQDDQENYYLGARTNTEESGDYGMAQRRGVMGSTSTASPENRRERVRFIECWYRMPQNVNVLRGDPDLSGEPYDAKNPAHQKAIDDGCSIVPHVRMQMRVALMTESMILYEAESPYKHNRFPLTPMWCYRRKRDGAPYGIIRDIRDPQVDYNKRASKALYILSTNRIIMDEGAVEDVEETRAEASRPDAMLVIRKNSRFEIANDKQLAEEHLMLMDRNKQAILDVGGVTNQNLGQDDKGLSGKAIGKLQDQGSIVNTPLFDNRLLALQIQSENQLSLIEQFYTEAKVLRIVGEKRPVEWMKLNQWDETEGQYLNDVTKSRADYIIDEQDFKASTRQAMFESMMELCAKLLPEVSLQLLDMVIDFADVPNKDEIVARIRKLNGQNDPSRKPTPEEEQASQQAQAEQQQVKQIQMATGKAQLDLLQAQIAEVQANIKKLGSDALKGNTASAYQAMQGAQIVATVPNITPVADAILAGAGYVDNQGTDPNLPSPEVAPPVAAPPQQMAPPPELMQADGAQAGIETVRPSDNLQQGM
jgi:hypothetical protein